MSEDYDEGQFDHEMESQEEMTEAEALAFSYKAPYPAAESELREARFEDLPNGKAFIIREADNSSYWSGPDLNNVDERDNAHVWTKESLESRYHALISSVCVEVLPLPPAPSVWDSTKQQWVVPAPAVEAKAPASTEPVKEVELNPGQVLYGLLKNNPSTAQTGGNFENKAAILKYMKQTMKNNYDYWNNVVDGGRLPDAMTIHTLCMMLNGDSQTITPKEYEELTKLTTACHARLNALCNKPVLNYAQRKLSSAITKTNGL